MKKIKLQISVDVSDLETYELTEEYDLDKLKGLDLNRKVEYLFDEASIIFEEDQLESLNSAGTGRSNQFELAKSGIKKSGFLDLCFIVGENEDKEFIPITYNQNEELNEIFGKLDPKTVYWLKKNQGKEKNIFNYKEYQKEIDFVENFEEKVGEIIESSKPYKDEKLVYDFGADRGHHHPFWKPKEKVYLEITKNLDIYYEINQKLGLEAEGFLKNESFYEDKNGLIKFKRWFDTIIKDFDRTEIKKSPKIKQKTR